MQRKVFRMRHVTTPGEVAGLLRDTLGPWTF